MHTQLQKQKGNTKTAATVPQKTTKSNGFSLEDNRATPTATQLMAKAHGKSCGCSNCTGATQMKAKVESNQSVAQLANSTTVIQLGKICSQCGYEGTHKPGCTPATRAAAAAARQEEAKQQHDKSMDSRTRADQSHKQHGGDAKGRTKMYERWNK